MFRGIFRAALFKSMVFNQPTKKAKAFKEAPTPRNVTELRSLLGMLVALTNFIPKLSTLAHSRYELIGKTPWNGRRAVKKPFVL